MEETTPQSGLQKFKSSKVAYPIGMIIGILVGIGLFYMGLYNALCGLGMVLIAAAMFVIIKWFGGKDLKKLIAFGVVFFLAITFVGAFAVSMPVIDRNTDVDNYESIGFKNVVITYADDNTISSVSVVYDGTLETGKEIVFHMGRLSFICYNGYGVYLGNDDSSNNGRDIPLTLDGSVYTSGTISAKMDSGTIYGYNFKIVEGNETRESSSVFFHKVNVSSGDELKFALIWNGYYVVMILAMYLIIVFFSYRAGKKMEKVRAEMEADGRLYPKGYGRCKQCGTVVLPGETNCRKCGAFIEVPEEFQKKQVEYCECSECGAHIPADSVFCPKCGAKFDEEDETIVVKDSEPADTEENEDRKE